MSFFILPNITDTMTIDEIVAAWRPIIGALYDEVIKSGFEDDAVDAYNGAMSMFTQDYTRGTDYVKPEVVDTDELPF